MKNFFVIAIMLTMSFSVTAQNAQENVSDTLLDQESSETIENIEENTEDTTEQENTKIIANKPITPKASTDDFVAVMLFEEMMLAAIKLYNGEENVNTSADHYQTFGFNAIPVSLEELRETIETNELAAEIAYDRPFVTTGRIEQITRVMGNPLVKLKPSGNKLALINTVSARFDDKYTPQLAKLKKGKTLTVACKSWRYAMSVSISDCQLMPEFYNDYKNSISARQAALRACEEHKTYAYLYAVKIASRLDAIEGDVVKFAMDYVKGSEEFSYTGIGKNIWEEEEFAAIPNASKDLIAELNVLREKGNKIEDCR